MRIRQALRRARFSILTIALTYVLSVAAGMSMVHSGNEFALHYRDNLVGTATRESSIMRQYQRGNFIAAAGLDALANSAGALLSIPAGYAIFTGYGIAAFRGWIGGIVSVDNTHSSRLAKPYQAFYYLMTLILQLIPYSMAGGAGVNLGIASFASPDRTGYRGSRLSWLKIPHDALADAAWIYLIALPLFAAASLFEFTM